MSDGMNENKSADTNKNKQIFIISTIACIAVAIIVIAASLVYNYFFKDNIINEEKQKVFYEQMDEFLEKDIEKAEQTKKQSRDIIKKYNLSIYGPYVTTNNELVSDQNSDVQSGATTKIVTMGMMINEDMTINFSDGKKGWWVLSESEDGIVHIGIGKDGADSMEMLIVSDDGTLINLSGAVFFGDIPAENTFEKTYKAGGLTLDFKKDGTLNGEYYELIKEDGEEFPWTEVYRGEYRKSEEYMDIMLNGAPARYRIFSSKTSDAEKMLTGFASSYYLKTEE